MNDLVDVEPCATSDCVFTPGVGISGVYFSFDSGASWIQPTYSGWSARSGTAQFGPIGTLPWYYESGLETSGDPAVAFGPARGSDGRFSWANGSRLYYLNIADNFGQQTVRGFTAIVLSRTDSPQVAALGGEVGKNAWGRPVIVSQRQSSIHVQR